MREEEPLRASLARFLYHKKYASISIGMGLVRCKGYTKNRLRQLTFCLPRIPYQAIMRAW